MILGGYRALSAESGVILGVAFAARTDHDLAAAIELRMDQDTHVRMQALLDRAAARGELAPGSVDAGFLLQTIASTLLGLIFRSASDDTEFLTRLVDELIIPALAPDAGRRDSGATLDDQEPLR